MAANVPFNMLLPPYPYHLKTFTTAELTAVYDIDRLSFPSPARKGLFEHEIRQNELAHYWVVYDQETLVGYGGYWLLADELHISTIAVHPQWRGKKLGELLLLQMLFSGYRHPANIATLEVRRSNRIAQNLYEKFWFELVGERRRYYRDTEEDALIMTVPALDARYYKFLEKKRDRLFAFFNCEEGEK